jgi:hypothetical protein
MLFFVKQFGKESVILMMKKVISISLTFLILAAMLHFSVATHYCGGTVAATKVSLSGKLASCGMEGDEKDLSLTGSHFASHCCENVLVFCGINSNYFPSFTYVPESYRHQFQVLNISAGLALPSLACNKSINTSVSPPDAFPSSSVNLSDICIFRI